MCEDDGSDVYVGVTVVDYMNIGLLQCMYLVTDLLQRRCEWFCQL